MPFMERLLCEGLLVSIPLQAHGNGNAHFSDGESKAYRSYFPKNRQLVNDLASSGTGVYYYTLCFQNALYTSLGHSIYQMSIQQKF
jgi:hypothetical protein